MTDIKSYESFADRKARRQGFEAGMTEEERVRMGALAEQRVPDRVELKTWPVMTGWSNDRLIKSLRPVADWLRKPEPSRIGHYGPRPRSALRVREAFLRCGRQDVELSCRMAEVIAFLLAPPRLYPEPRPDLAAVVERVIRQFG